jgi:hypothetical protein
VLIAKVTAADAGRIEGPMLKLLNRAKVQARRAEKLASQGSIGTARGALKQAVQALSSFASRVNSLAGRQVLGAGRAMFTEMAAPIKADMRTLLGSAQLKRSRTKKKS